MPVVFYHMEGCGFCKKAKDELVDEIASGKVIVKDSKEAPAGVRGFPHFVNEDNGKSVTGFKPAALLMKELGVVGVGPMPSTRRPMPPKPPTPAGMPMPPMPRGSPMPRMGGMPMGILFFFMPGCGFCEKCKKMFANEISQGLIQLMPHTKAPKHVRGFPHFIGPNGVEHSGAPKTKEELMGKLLNGGGMPMPPPNGGMPMPPPMPEQPLLREGYVRVSKERYMPQNQRAQGGVMGNARAAGAELYNHPKYQNMAKHAMQSVGHLHM